MTSMPLGLLALRASGLAARLAAGVPDVGRREGQRLAGQELSEGTFFQRIFEWFANLLNTTGNAVPGGWFGLIVLAVVVVLAITVVVFWVRPAAGARAGKHAVLDGQARTAADYRSAAERYAAAAEFGAAIVEGVRAIAAELEQRGVLPQRAGRTADELAFEAGRELPGLSDDLHAVARMFDDIRYGGRDGTQAGYLLVNRVDDDVRSARMLASAAPQPVTAAHVVPR